MVTSGFLSPFVYINFISMLFLGEKTEIAGPGQSSNDDE